MSFSEVDTLYLCPEFPTVIDLVSDVESEEEPDVVLADGEEFVDIFENPSTLLVNVDSLPVSPSLTPAQSSDALEPSIESSDDDIPDFESSDDDMPDLDDGLSSSDESAAMPEDRVSDLPRRDSSSDDEDGVTSRKRQGGTDPSRSRSISSLSFRGLRATLI